MYDLSSIKQHNPTFIFKIPTADNGYSMLSMQRCDFAEPTFPNITTEHMKLMKSRINNISTQVSTKSEMTGIIKEISESSTRKKNKHEDNDWRYLGLEGWTGDISRPIELPVNQNGKNHLKEVNPTKHIVSIGETKVEAFTKTLKMANLTAPQMNDTKKLAANIFIARVNDPFGYSTKWELRNSTKDLKSLNFTDDRSKRDLVKLYSMIKCSTGCNPLAYKGYGCYCGFLGAGVPVNGIDRCCKLHDKCYEYSNCISYLEYFVPYIWKCYRGKPLCAFDHGEWGGPVSCAARLCYCDLRLSRCLRKFACPARRAICTSSTTRQLQNLLLTF